jgi:hypothetical protein
MVMAASLLVSESCRWLYGAGARSVPVPCDLSEAPWLRPAYDGLVQAVRDARVERCEHLGDPKVPETVFGENPGLRRCPDCVVDAADPRFCYECGDVLTDAEDRCVLGSDFALSLMWCPPCWRSSAARAAFEGAWVERG